MNEDDFDVDAAIRRHEEEFLEQLDCELITAEDERHVMWWVTTMAIGLIITSCAIGAIIGVVIGTAIK